MARRPPLLARILLRVAAPSELYAELAGDLEERFHARSPNGRGASLGYWKDVLSPSLLTLRRGWWGDELLLPEEWFELATTPTSAQPGYGFMKLLPERR